MTVSPPEPKPEPDRTDPGKRLHFRIRESLRASFIAGVLVTGPVTLTLYVAWLFVDFVDRSVLTLLPERYNPAHYLPFHVPGIGLIVVVISLMAIGTLAAGYFGRLLWSWGDEFVNRMPLIRNLYGTVKQLFETVLSNQSQSFREVVLVRYPHPDSWTIAFVTGRPEGAARAQFDEEMVTVYVPTTPNPTSGYLLFLPRREVVTLGMTVEEGIKYVISLGIVAPPQR